ncbi:hypothetical protein AUK40_05960 [Candidatus Wirthbacteria bacterium CG2_30_54_11]|uniref:Transcriptional repressor n=1 Tax=Candidatus Wirthbacteria bacterium CG2_30_54_11 TaxID=1817892 RepID=A0A1J5IES1_9BACT|nr:MAG: hypothetical protein AUK40_05960 [Candidatus Wirthbacteria bacterium CG2_30_54_11]
MPLAAELKSRGLPITRSRRAIAEFLDASTAALSAIEIIDHLHSQGITVNKTTVYRELDILEREHLVVELDMGDGLKRYELSPRQHHHHLFCASCKKVVCLPVEQDLGEVEKQLENQTNFKISGHDLKFFGTCSDCLSITGRDQDE